MESETVVHIIKIDDNTELALKIPKITDIATFTAILEKARKVFKIGEVEVEVGSERRPHERGLSPEEMKRRIDEWYKATEEGKRQIAVNAGVPRKAYYAKLQYYKKQLNIKSAPTTLTQEDSSELLAKITAMAKDNVSIEDIAKKLGMTKKRVYDFVYYKTKKGVSSLYKNGGK